MKKFKLKKSSKRQKVEAVVEAQLSTNTSFYKTILMKILLQELSGKIEVEYTGADVVQFALGGPGSEKFNIDQTGNITLREELDFEDTQSYNLLVFTVLGDKSITNKLDFNVVDIDEEPNINLKLFSTSLSENISTNTKLGELEIIDPEKNGISTSIIGVDSEKVIISSDGEIVLQAALDYEKKRRAIYS